MPTPEVTFCVHWTYGSPPTATLECTDVIDPEDEATAKARVLRKAKTRMDGGQTPLIGSTLSMEKLVGALGSYIASQTVSSPWVDSWDSFVAACFD